MKHARWDVYEAADGWRWRLLAANGRTLASGESHTRKADAVRALETVRETAIRAYFGNRKPGSKIDLSGLVTGNLPN